MFTLPEDLLIYISKYSYFILILIVLQGSLMLILLYMFLEHLFSFRKLKVRQEVEKQEAFAQAVKILEDSKEQSLKILEESHEKARGIIGQFKGISEETKKELEQQMGALAAKHLQDLQQMSQSFSEDYERVIKEEKERSVAQIHDTSEKVKNELLGEVSEFKDILREETFKTEEGVKKKITDEYNAVREEIEEYRKQKLAALDNKIFEIVHEVLKEVIGKSMSLEDKQDIVFKVLEKSKKESKWTL